MSRALRAAALLVCAVLLCCACNAAAFLIDTPDMRENAAQGVSMLGEQESRPQLIGGFKSTQLDNYTAILMIKTAGYTGHRPLAEKALGGFYTEAMPEEGQTAWDAFSRYLPGAPDLAGDMNYSRYWHGYTLPLRLLLCVMNLSNIQMTLSFLQLALMAACLLLMARRKLGRLIPGFFIAYFLLSPMTLGVCLQYATASLPMLAACCLLLLADESIDRLIGMPAFFALVGLMTNYLDLLTFPLVTLGFPLVLLLALRLRAGDSLAHLFSAAFFCCAGWGVGFGGMWVLKWLLTALVFGWGQIGSIVSQIFLRVSTESEGESFSRMAVLAMNLSVITDKAAYLLLLGLTGLATLAPAGIDLINTRRLHIDARAFIMLMPLFVSLLWYIVMANHSRDHTFYTYRGLSVAVLSGYALLGCLFPEEDR